MSWIHSLPTPSIDSFLQQCNRTRNRYSIILPVRFPFYHFPFDSWGTFLDVQNRWINIVRQINLCPVNKFLINRLIVLNERLSSKMKRQSWIKIKLILLTRSIAGTNAWKCSVPCQIQLKGFGDCIGSLWWPNLPYRWNWMRLNIKQELF